MLLKASNIGQELHVHCGICGQLIQETLLTNPKPISNYDKDHDIKRDHSFNCCEKSWLINQDNTPCDCGPKIID